MDINYNYLRVFEVVARYGNLTMAANELMVSQPSVSLTIQKLEKSLGCKLFERKPKGMVLTAEGEVLYVYVRDSLNILSRGLTNITMVSSGCPKVLHITGSQSIVCTRLFPQILMEYRKANPSVSIRIHGCHADHAIHRLSFGLSDLAVTYSPVILADSMEIIPLAKTEPIFIRGKRFEELSGRKIPMSELLGYPLISYSDSGQGKYFWNEIFTPFGFNPSAELDVNSTEMLLSAVKADMGIGLILRQSAEMSLEKGYVFEVKTDLQMPSRVLNLVAPKGKRQAHIQAFIDMVCSHADPTLGDSLGNLA